MTITPAEQAKQKGPLIDPSNKQKNYSLPERYCLKELNNTPWIWCQDTPTLNVSVDRSHAFSEADARKLGENIILLDGAGQFAPTVDEEKQVYNLDHHEGCLRSFTLASCEQALIIVLKGVELDKNSWSIFANEPDLDTIFAIWVLFNYRRIRDMKPKTRNKIVPLLRLEGAIDANGLQFADFCGLPSDVLKPTHLKLNQLRQHEVRIKQQGQWTEIDFNIYTIEILHEIDKLVYSWIDFKDFRTIEEEYSHIEIGENRVAVICRDNAGIYEVETRLKKVWGDQLGIIVLENGPKHFTLRRTAAFSGIDLKKAYDKLNLFDPEVDGRPPEKQWGGSDEIGGSPKPDGTRLNPYEIARVLHYTYQDRNKFNGMKSIWMALLAGLLIPCLACISIIICESFLNTQQILFFPFFKSNLYALCMGFGSLLFLLLKSPKDILQRGWSLPVGRDWLILVPLIWICCLAGTVFTPSVDWSDLSSLFSALTSLLVFVIALEMLFRSLIPLLLLIDHKVQWVAGEWFISLPVWISAFLYAGTALACGYFDFIRPPLPMPTMHALAFIFGSTFLNGLGLGLMRERSLSIWPGVVCQFTGGILLLALKASL